MYIRASDTGKKAFTVNSIVVKVKSGLISELVWDNACYDCDEKCEKNIISRSELNNSNTMSYENCYENDMTKCVNNTCDPKFYITWFGTDGKNNQLKSSNLALSKFRKYSISSLYNSMKNIFTGT